MFWGIHNILINCQMIKTCNLPWKDKDGAGFWTTKGMLLLNLELYFGICREPGICFSLLRRDSFNTTTKGHFNQLLSCDWKNGTLWCLILWWLNIGIKYVSVTYQRELKNVSILQKKFALVWYEYILWNLSTDNAMISEALGVGRKSMNTKTNHMCIPGKKYIANIVKIKDCQ